MNDPLTAMATSKIACCCIEYFQRLLLCAFLVYTLTLWLQLANRLAKKTCLLAMDSWQIDPLDSTTVPQMANKSDELIKDTGHEWLIIWPQDYQP